MDQSKDRDEMGEGLNLPPASMSLAGLQLDSLRFYRRESSGSGGDPEDEPSEFSLRDVLYVLFRHKKKILFCFTLCSLLMICYVATVPDTYLSEASVSIRRERMGLTLDPMGIDGSFLKDAPISPDMIRGEIAILQSNDLALQVVDELGPETIIGFKRRAGAAEGNPMQKFLTKTLDALNLSAPVASNHDLAIQIIKSHLVVKAFMGGGSVMSVEYTSHSPEAAQRILDAILAAYEQKHILVNKSRITPEFFKTRSDTLSRSLKEKETELEALKKKLNITSPENEKEILLARLNNQESLAQTAEVAISTAQARIESLEKARGGYSKTVPGGRAMSGSAASPVDGTLRMRLLDLKIKEKELAGKFTDDYPQLQDLRNQIQETEKMLTDQATGAEPIIPQLANPDYRDLELRLDSERAELKAQIAGHQKLQNDIVRTKTEIANLLNSEKEVVALSHEVEKLRQQYNQYLNSVQIADISTTLDDSRIANVRIIQSASLPSLSQKSLRKLIALLVFGCFMGLAFGVALAASLEFLDHSVKTGEDVEKQTGLPVLITIPKTKHHKPEPQGVIA